VIAIKQIKVNGVSLAFEELGEKCREPVVFVHGSASDYRTWATQTHVFAEKYHTLAYSRRSHYPNPYISYPPSYTIKTEIDDLTALIENLTDRPVHLIGWSYGAYIAAALAENHSHLLRSLVLAEPPIMSF
jgi:non-heme chloroperoxidase